MRATMLNRTMFGIVIVAIVLTPIGHLFGQDRPIAREDSQKVAEPVAIDPLSVTHKSEELLTMLQEYDKALQQNMELDQISGRYSAFKEEISQLMEDPGFSNPDQFNERDFADGIAIWNGFKLSLNTWLAELDHRSQTLNKILQNLTKTQTRWTTTRSRFIRANYPPSLLQTINENLGKIKALKNAYHARLEIILDLQNDISLQNIRISKILSDLETARDEYRIQLIKQDSQPVWNIYNDSTRVTKLLEEIETTFIRQQRFVSYYYQVNGTVLIYQFFILIGVFLIIYLIRKKKSRLEVHKTFNIFLSHRYASTVLVFTLLSALLLPRAPLFINSLYLILLAIPMVRIFKKLIPREFGRSLSVFVLTLILFEIKLIIPPKFIVERILQILMAGFILFVLQLLLKPALKKAIKNKVELARLILFVRITNYLMLLSIMLNLYGNTTLSNLLLDGCIRSAFATMIIILGVWFMQGIFTVMLSLPAIAGLSLMKRKADLIEQRGMKYLRWGGSILIVYFVLEYFQLRSFTFNLIALILNFRIHAGSLTISFGNIISFGVAIWVTFLVSRFTRFILEEDVFPRIRLPRGVPGSISLLAHYTILAIGFLLALSAAGIEWTKFALIAGALGVGVGFGLQDVVNNFISGLILIFERPVKLGDVVELENLRGTVKRIGIRSSTIRTFDGSEVIVPNGMLISNTVVNWTLSDKQRRVIIQVGVAYGTDPNRVLDILMTAANTSEEILEKPEPQALFTAFGESSLDFELRFWTDNFNEWLELKHRITLDIHNRLKAADIEIPFPQRDLNIRTLDDAVAKKLQNESEGFTKKSARE